jgi:hypothetical protein
MQSMLDLEGAGASLPHLAGGQEEIEAYIAASLDPLDGFGGIPRPVGGGAGGYGGAGTTSGMGVSYVSDYVAGDCGGELPRICVVGQDKPLRSVLAAARTPEWEGSWKPAFKVELARIFDRFRTMQYVPASHRARARLRHGAEAVITQRLVVPFRVKHTAAGVVTRHTARVTYADTGIEGRTADSFSANLAGHTFRYVLALYNELPGATVDTNDVSGAYYYGTPLRPDEGGFEHYAEVPPGWEEFGYAQFSASGERMLFYISGNMPGRRDGGLIWDREYTPFLVDFGMTQCLTDRRLFYMRGGPEDEDDDVPPVEPLAPGRVGADPTTPAILIVGVIVDDSLMIATRRKLLRRFLAAWALRFDSSPSSDTPGSRDFGGVRIDRIADGVLALSNGKLINDVSLLIARYPKPRGPFLEPMLADGLVALAEVAGVGNPAVGAAYVEAFRQILGIIMFVAGSTRPDIGFATIAISRVATRLTERGWGCLLRLAHYLVATRELCLTFRRSGTAGDPCRFVFDCDASLLNADGGAGGSWGGGVGAFGRGGAFTSSVTLPRKLTDSSGGAELVQATIVLKDVLAFRMLARELGFAERGPTRMRMDANAVLLGVKREKVSKAMRYVAGRYAMLRAAVEEGEVVLEKVASADNRADICTKPLTGVPFAHQRALILGLTEASDPAPTAGAAEADAEADAGSGGAAPAPSAAGGPAAGANAQRARATRDKRPRTDSTTTSID